jgi:putative endonuclease
MNSHSLSVLRSLILKMRALRFLIKTFKAKLHVPFHPHFLNKPLHHRELGYLGECLAAKWLQQQPHYKILYRNFTDSSRAEIDLIARHQNTLCFIEVKTRRSLSFGRPATAVTSTKQHSIIRASHTWLRLLHYPQISYRYDIIEVILTDGYLPEITHITNAFTSS